MIHAHLPVFLHVSQNERAHQPLTFHGLTALLELQRDMILKVKG